MVLHFFQARINAVAADFNSSTTKSQITTEKFSLCPFMSSLGKFYQRYFLVFDVSKTKCLTLIWRGGDGQGREIFSAGPAEIAHFGITIFAKK